MQHDALCPSAYLHHCADVLRHNDVCQAHANNLARQLLALQPHLVCDLVVQVIRVCALGDEPLKHLVAGLGVLALLARTPQPAGHMQVCVVQSPITQCAGVLPGTCSAAGHYI